MIVTAAERQRSSTSSPASRRSRGSCGSSSRLDPDDRALAAAGPPPRPGRRRAARSTSGAATSSCATCSAPTASAAPSPSATRSTVGTTVQFQVRDADSADEDLRALLAGRRPPARCVFTCNGRGTHLFGAARPRRRAGRRRVAGGAIAGMFCAGEIGPVGGRSFLHGFTASVLLFDADAAGSAPIAG